VPGPASGDGSVGSIEARFARDRIGNAAKRVVEQRLELGLGLVDELAERGALFLGHGAHLFHKRGQFAVGADETALAASKSRP